MNSFHGLFVCVKYLKMNGRRLIFLVTLMLVLCGFAAHAQNDSIMHIEKRYSIYFRVNRADVDRTYLENAHVIETMISDIQTTLETEGYTPDSLVIYASASPEGPYELNARLAKMRAESTKRYILQVLPQLNSAKIYIESRTNDWSGILQAARADESLPYREQIIRVLSDSRITNKDAALRAMPAVYAYIRDNMLNKLRTATVTIQVIGKIDEFAVEREFALLADSLATFPAEGGVRAIAYEKSVNDDLLPTVTCEADWVEEITVTADSILVKTNANPIAEVRIASMAVTCYGITHELAIRQEAAEPVVEPDPVVEPAVEPDPVEPVVKPESEKKPYYLAARSNMLYDLLLVPNIGLDIYLGKNLSLSANWMYSWWKDDNIHWYWRTYGGDLGIRYWFGKAANEKPLQGHHVGLYGQIITYDFELGGRGYLGDRWTYGGGIEYGYSLPVAKRLNIDFGLGFGYLGGEFKEYLPIDGHYVWQATKRRHFIGPTKLEIMLVWQLGRGNINADKGGKR